MIRKGWRVCSKPTPVDVGIGALLDDLRQAAVNALFQWGVLWQQNSEELLAIGKVGQTDPLHTRLIDGVKDGWAIAEHRVHIAIAELLQGQWVGVESDDLGVLDLGCIDRSRGADLHRD